MHDVRHILSGDVSLPRKNAVFVCCRTDLFSHAYYNPLSGSAQGPLHSTAQPPIPTQYPRTFRPVSSQGRIVRPSVGIGGEGWVWGGGLAPILVGHSWCPTRNYF